MRVVRKFLDDERGSGMVEFALVSSLFLFILIGIFEFGFVAWARNSLASDARAGARYAMVRSADNGYATDSAAVATYVKSKSALGNSIVVIPTWAPNKSVNSKVTVKVRYLSPRRGPFLGAHTDSSSSTMLVIF